MRIIKKELKTDYFNLKLTIFYFKYKKECFSPFQQYIVIWFIVLQLRVDYKLCRACLC